MNNSHQEPASFRLHRGLRVAVVPLGGVPDSRFQVYLSLLQRFSEIPIANLSKPGTWKKEKSPFKYFSWFDGTLVFKFLDRSQMSETSEWQDYQAHRRAWAVIGVLHIPSCEPGNLSTIEAEFQNRVKEFPHAIAKKIFCFGHSFDGGQDLDGFSNKESLVIFPPEGDIDTGMSMVELHMGVMLNDVSVMVLTHLEEEVTRTKASSKKSAKRGQWLGIRSPFDDDDGKKGNQGRISKWVGDLCLLAGTPQDAIESYAAAISECKAAGDNLWQAGSIEGWIASTEVMTAWHLPMDEYLGRDLSRDLLIKDNPVKTLMKEIEDKASEALTLLDPHGTLAVELCFKMARYHGSARPSRYNEALSYIMRAMGTGGLLMQQQVMRSLEAAALCRWLGLSRKFAFLLRLAAIQSSELQNFASAHSLGRVAAAAYGVTFLDGPTSSSMEDSSPSPTRRDVRAIFPPPPGGWPCLQKHLLSDLVAFSTSAKDVTAACGYYLALLHLLSELEASRQRAIDLGGGQFLSSAAAGGGVGYALAAEPSPLQASSHARPKLLALDTVEINAEANLSYSRHGHQTPGSGTSSAMNSTHHSRTWSKESDPEGGGDDARSEIGLSTTNITEERRAGPSSASWQISRSGRSKPTSSSIGFTKFSFKNRSSVLKPFRSGMGRSGGGDERGEEDHATISASEGSLLAPNVAASPEEQEALITEMMKLTRRLPPRTPLDIRGFPTVHFVRPMRLAGDMVPLERAAVGGGGPSAFIYNPFGEQGEGSGASVTWAAGEVAQVALALSNPVGAPLNIQGIELVVEPEGVGSSGGVEGVGDVTSEGGGEGAAQQGGGGSGREGGGGNDTVAFCYPLTLWVPAYKKFHPLTLAVKPLSPGGLIIRGTRLTVFNITSQVNVDVQGNGPTIPPRSDPRDWYPRRANYSRAPKGDKAALAALAAAGAPEAAIPTNRVSVVAPLPCLTTRLDRWATNVELFPGEYRRTSLQLQVTNEVSIGYLEVSVHQKALTKKQKAAGRPVTLYVFSEGMPCSTGSPSRGPLSPFESGADDGTGNIDVCVTLDPLGLDSLTATLRGALRSGSCLSSLFLPLLLRRVDRFPEADIFVKYSTAADHRHHRTLTIPLRFHLKEGLSATDLSVETASAGIYPALARVIETCHRAAWEPLRRRGKVEIDTDHEECYLLAEVHNAANEDLHIKTCLMDTSGGLALGKSGETALTIDEQASLLASSPPRSRLLHHHASLLPPSEVALLKETTSTPTSITVRPRTSRRIVIPFSRLESSSPLLQPPPPPPPPPGGGQAPKPVITLDAPEWTRALHGLCRSLRMQWSDPHGVRSGLLRLPTTLTSTVRPSAMERIRLPPLRLACFIGGSTSGEGGAVVPPLSPSKHQPFSLPPFTILRPLASPHTTTSPPPPAEDQQPSSPSSPTTSPPPSPTSTITSSNKTFPPYVFIPIHFRITNRSLKPLPPTKCFCHAFQDYGNGNLNFQIDSIRAMWSGSLAWTTPVLEPGSSATHVTFVSFTASGKYGVGFSASFMPDEISRGGGGTVDRPSSVRFGSSSGGGGFMIKGGEGANTPVVYWGQEALEIVIIEVGDGREMKTLVDRMVGS